VIFGTTALIAHDSLEHLCDSGRFHDEPRFFTDFPPDAILQGLARFEHTAWKRPKSFQGLAPSLGKKDSTALEDQRSYAQNRPFWISTANRLPLPWCRS
jgi:hypothetical protein